MYDGMGEPVPRADAPLKVQGRADYAADFVLPGMAHAVLVVSTIGRGRIVAMDTAQAEAQPGVMLVMTHRNAPRMVPSTKKVTPVDRILDLLQDDLVHYANQPIGVVVAETLEAAAGAAMMVRTEYAAEAPVIELDAASARKPEEVGAGDEADFHKGDAAAALQGAAARVEPVYGTPDQYHNPLEPHATMAAWEGETVTLYTGTQSLYPTRNRAAELLGLPQESVRVINPYVGGGFGSKGPTWSHVLLAAMAAKQVGRPVRLALERQRMFGMVGHRARTEQTLRLGAGRDGTLVSLAHETVTQTSEFEDFTEPSGVISRSLYATPALASTHRVQSANVGTPSFMRAPGEASGSYALECAMDEMAYELGMDPVAFRLKNYAEVETETGKPFSSKSLRECYAQGAARFGWEKRALAPRSMRDAEGHLVGWGMGTSTYPTRMMQAQASVRLMADGTARVGVATHDLGTGTWTILAQVAAEGLGLPLDRVRLEIGDSRLPNGGTSGGSTTAATSGSAIYKGCQEAVRAIAAIAVADRNSPLFGAGNADVVARGGRLELREDGSRGEAFEAVLRRAGKESVEGMGKASLEEDADTKHYAMHAFGAVFAEVKVDPELGQMRATRLVGAFASGRLLNPRTARSQYLGGMVWGVSFALYEHALTDVRSGMVVNNNLAEYHIPVNADVPHLEAILVDEVDEHVNPLGVKGIGEIGITGTAGAVANAVWHATGKRVRELPITLDKLL